MDTKGFIHAPDKVHACIVERGDQLIAKKKLKIIQPVRFAERRLSFIGVEKIISGFYGITVDDKYYASSQACALIKIEPTAMAKVSFNGDEYYEFTFEAGSVITESVMLPRQDTYVFQLFDEIASRAHIPWYMNYEDLGRILETAKYHANANIGTSPEIIELFISLVTRSPKDRHMYYRQVVKTDDDLKRILPDYISVRDVEHGATNTSTKFAGSYMDDGVISALSTPSTRVERIEGLLRT